MKPATITQILEKINSKGWDLYRISNMEEDLLPLLRAGAVNALEVGNEYALIVKTNTTNPALIREAMINSVRKYKAPPQINVGGSRLYFGSMAVQSKSILVKDPSTASSKEVSYKELYESLDTLTTPD